MSSKEITKRADTKFTGLQRWWWCKDLCDSHNYEHSTKHRGWLLIHFSETADSSTIFFHLNSASPILMAGYRMWGHELRYWVMNQIYNHYAITATHLRIRRILMWYNIDIKLTLNIMVRRKKFKIIILWIQNTNNVKTDLILTSV